MATQTSYSEDFPARAAGHVHDMQKSNIISRAAEGEIPFGVVVVRGTDAERQCKQPTAAGGSVLGLTVRYRAGDADTPNGYGDTREVGILNEGTIHALATRAVTAGDAVTFLVTDGTLGSDDVDATHEAVPGATWDTTADAGDLATIAVR